MTDDPNRDPDQLVRDLEAIEFQVPKIPAGYGTLRQLLATLPAPLAPDIQSARVGAADPAASPSLGIGGVPTGIQGEPPGYASGGAIGVYPQLFFGVANLLRDPAFELVNEADQFGNYGSVTTTEVAIATDVSAVSGAGGAAIDCWFAQQIGATAATMAYAGHHYRNLPDFSPYNSSSLALRIDPTGSGTHVLRVRSGPWDGSGGPGYPYLTAAVRITTDKVNALSLITSATLTVQLVDLTSSIIRASRVIDITNMAQFDQSIQVVASSPYAGQTWEGHTFECRILLTVVSTGNAAAQEWILGEPQLVQGQIENPPPFAPIVATWIPTRVRQTGLNSVDAVNYPILSTPGLTIFSSTILWSTDVALSRAAAGIIRVDRNGSSGVSGFDMRQGAAPATPPGPAKYIRLYANSVDRHLHQIDDLGVDTDLTAGGGGGVSLGGVAGSAHIGTGGAVGVAGTAAESDHQHPAQVSLDSASGGSHVARIKFGVDATYRAFFGVDASSRGALEMGGGTAARDFRLIRTAAGQVVMDAIGGAVDTQILVQATAGQNGSIEFKVVGDAGQTRLVVEGDATFTGIAFGGGAANRDLRFYRNAAGVAILDSATSATASQLSVASTAGQRALLTAFVAGDANSRFVAYGDATEQGIELGAGGTRDIRIFRAAAGQVSIDSNSGAVTTNLTVEATAAQANVIGLRVAGDTATRFVLEGDATEVGFRLGPGNAARDLRVFRSGAKVLTIDDTAGGAVTLNVKNTIQQNGTGVSVIGHGAADHADITREIMLVPETAGLDGATLIAVGASPNLTRAINYADAATSGAYWWWYVPLDWASGVINIRPLWTPAATDGTAHTVRWSVTAKEITTGTDVTAAGTTTAFTGTSAARTVNIAVTENLQSTGITPSGTGVRLKIELQRIGADAADTYVGAVRLYGLVVSYTANQ